MKEFILETRESTEYKTLISRRHQYTFAYEKYIDNDRKNVKTYEELFGIFISRVPFNIIHLYLEASFKRYKQIHEKK